MPGQQVSSGFAITIDGTPLPADIEQLLVEAYVDHSRNLPDLFVLRFRDANRLVLAKTGAKVGSKVKVGVLGTDDQGPQPLISAEVTALEADFDTTGTFTLIRGYDLSHRLFRGQHAETYTQVTASDVAVKVARRAGLAIGTVQSTTTVFDHVSQAGVSDWAFLSGLAREIGYEVAVSDDKFQFRPPGQAADAPAAGSGPVSANPLVLELGTDLLRVRSVVTSAEQVSQTHVRGWDTAQKKAIVGTASASTPSADLPGATPAGLASVFGDQAYVATGVPYRMQAEVDVAATAVAEQIAGAFAELDAVARGNPKIQAGVAVSIANFGSPFDGKYTVTTSRHHFSQDSGYVTQFAVTGRQERSLLGLASGGAASGGASGGSHGTRLFGVVIALVSDVNDPQNLGRVKVTYPWLSDDYVSDWARTVQSGAGHQRGAMVVPEVGDEVLVAFEHGDPRWPYVVGGLYNGVDTPKAGPVDVVDSGSGEINRRSFVSRRGHRMDFLDQAGKADGVTISTGDDKLRLQMDATGTKLTIHSDGTVIVEASQGVTIDASSASVELKGGDIKLTGRNGVTIDGGGGAVKVTAGSDLSLSGLTAKLEGSAQAEVKGGATCSISAGLVRIN
jgi:phage protein D/phage baseplate assembly protein gpV